MSKRIFSIVLILSMLNSFFFWIDPISCFAKITQSEMNVYIDEFDEDTKKVIKLQESFYRRHKWKIIGAAAAGVAVAGIITFATWGAGTGGGIAAGVSTTSYLVGGSASAATITAGTVASGLAAYSLYGYAMENDIEMTPELRERIMGALYMNRKLIMANSNSREDAHRKMIEIAISVMEDKKDLFTN